MKTISPQSFAMICFLALMQNGEGLLDKAPSYITEKMDVLTANYDAFSYLDFNNMTKVVDWCNVWKVELPIPVSEEYKLQCEAARNLNII